MKKLRVFESISVDGYFTDADGDIGWAHAGRDDAEFADWVGGNASGGGELLFGRRTYQMPAVARGINAARKYVASRTIRPTWNNTFLLQADLISAVPDLKAADGSGITVLGSGKVAAQLGDAGLVDEYQFVIIPVALGGGRTVFAKERKLRLFDQRTFRCGNVVVTYAT